jgi:repressor LexA
MQYTKVVEAGEMAAVWLRKEGEVTLKRFFPEEKTVRLEPANRQMQPIHTAVDNVEIQGRVIGVIRYAP